MCLLIPATRLWRTTTRPTRTSKSAGRMAKGSSQSHMDQRFKDETNINCIKKWHDQTNNTLVKKSKRSNQYPIGSKTKGSNYSLRAECSSHGGDLASVHNDAENLFLTSLLRPHGQFGALTFLGARVSQFALQSNMAPEELWKYCINWEISTICDTLPGATKVVKGNETLFEWDDRSPWDYENWQPGIFLITKRKSLY